MAYIALGANLGRRQSSLRRALALLDSRADISVERVSSFIETAAVGGPPGQPKYINAAASLRTSLGPRELLGVLLDIERQLGRVRDSTERNAPRTLDLDLLLYDQLVLDEPGLHLPHTRLHERRFVLAPLCEIAPEAAHPQRGKTVREMLRALNELLMRQTPKRQ